MSYQMYFIVRRPSDRILLQLHTVFPSSRSWIIIVIMIMCHWLYQYERFVKKYRNYTCIRFNYFGKVFDFGKKIGSKGTLPNCEIFFMFVWCWLQPFSKLYIDYGSKRWPRTNINLKSNLNWSSQDNDDILIVQVKERWIC